MVDTAARLIDELRLAPCRWSFPDPDSSDPSGLVVTGGDLAPSTLITAYCSGIFPMPLRRRRLGWWSPDPRGVLPLDRLAVSRSLRRSMRRFEIRIDTAFTSVVERCSDPRRPHGWITPEILRAYRALHRLGLAHSVETWSDGELVGGLYGVSIGALFAGESMFHRATDASKVALVALAHLLTEGRSDDVEDAPLLDVQWNTPHLASLGAIQVRRDDYLRESARATAQSPTVFPSGPVALV